MKNNEPNLFSGEKGDLLSDDTSRRGSIFHRNMTADPGWRIVGTLTGEVEV